mmetsp:Transcript_10588/g.30267  ORF Transcript_10588/g.30267 Transcript_10588/m.30267 type:complete len:269 (-) Transcript_10588:101-907(-)
MSSGSSEPPLWVALCAGSVGGLCNTISGYPLDTVKVRLQTGNTQALFRGLFKGITAPISTVAPFWATLYFGYKAGKSIQPDDSPLSAARAGAVAGICGCFVWVPMQAVKCIAQDRHCRSSEALRILRSQVGLAGFYRGFVPTLLLFSIPGSAAFYWTYETSTARFGAMWWTPFVAGGLAGCLEWTVGMPGDTLRTRYQTSYRHDSVLQCARELVASHGVSGFYRGYSAALARAFVSNGAALLGIEAVNTAYTRFAQGAAGGEGSCPSA